MGPRLEGGIICSPNAAALVAVERLSRGQLRALGMIRSLVALAVANTGETYWLRHNADWEEPETVTWPLPPMPQALRERGHPSSPVSGLQ